MKGEGMMKGRKRTGNPQEMGDSIR